MTLAAESPPAIVKEKLFEVDVDATSPRPAVLTAQKAPLASDMGEPP